MQPDDQRFLSRIMRTLTSSVMLVAAMGAHAAGDGDAQASRGLEAWGRIQQVLLHPRCANCHVGDDATPRWPPATPGGTPRVHGMGIVAGTDRMGVGTGLPCMTCHTAHNGQTPHSPPGAPGWALAPASMQWFGKTSAQVCRQLKDPARNGGRSIAQVADHIAHEPLVQWSWAPGPGREPAPYSAQEVARLVEAWGTLGAPCPS